MMVNYRKRKLRGGALAAGAISVSNANDHYAGDRQEIMAEAHVNRQQTALQQMNQRGGYDCGNSNQMAGDPNPAQNASLQALECRMQANAEYDVSGGGKKRRKTRKNKKRKNKKQKKRRGKSNKRSRKNKRNTKRRRKVKKSTKKRGRKR